MVSELTCADLFCGAGGFSEGFRQAGYRVTKALDIWAPAVTTHEHDHPDTEAIRGDILAYDPELIGPVDVLIGSPPCTEFSFANRGGSGDIEAGMRLVYRFLRFVYELEPRWWVMENVPRVLDFLPEAIPLRKLGIDKRGSLEIPARAVLVSADFGAPQKRARAFSGRFPIPAATHADPATRIAQGPATPTSTAAVIASANATPAQRWRTLRDVVETLPDPLGAQPAVVRDPVYGFELPARELTDHFADDLVLTDEEVRENRKAKADHSWYGRMSFPDELDRPARTVMATNLRVARETTVIASSNGGYRRLSVRESSTVQGFPITYQWWGATASLKYKLVGNAVAPPIAYAIARAIRSEARAEGHEAPRDVAWRPAAVRSEVARAPAPDRPYVVTRVADPAPEAATGRERRRQLPLTRRFREHIPGSKVPGFRVDLDNQGEAPGRHLVEWRTVLYRGSGKALRRREVDLHEALRLLGLTVADARTARRARAFLAALARDLALVPDASTLQRIRAERVVSDVTPYVVIERVGEIVARHFGAEPRVVRIESRRDPERVPQPIAATLVASAYACALANGKHGSSLRLAVPPQARVTATPRVDATARARRRSVVSSRAPRRSARAT